MTGELLTTLDDGVLWVTFNRPDSLNALTTPLFRQATAVISAAESDDNVRVIVLAGAGRGFSSGADLAADRETAGPSDEGMDAANSLVTAIREVPKPVVAAVTGPAAGVGASIALACDLAVASESAFFVLSFANVGLMPDGGATFTVQALAGRMRAVRMALLGERIGAQTAYDWGLISHLTSDDEHGAVLSGIVRRLASGPAESYALTKRAINLSAQPNLEAALAAEKAGQVRLFASADFQEGVRAFNARETPKFAHLQD